MIHRLLTAFRNRRDTRCRRHRRMRGRRLGVEALESRQLLSAVSWDGGGDGTSWTDARNWAGDALPTASDDVSIGFGAHVVTDRDVTIHSGQVQSGGALRLGGNLTVSDDLTNDGTVTFGGRSNQTLTVSGGTFLNTGTITYQGGDYQGKVLARLVNRGTLNDKAGYLLINTAGTGITDPQPVDPALTFANTGEIVLSNAAHCYLGGLVDPNDLGAIRGTGYLGVHMVAWHLDTDWTLPVTTVILGISRSSITGAGSLTIPAGDVVGLGAGTTLDVDVVNHGTLGGNTASTINGQLFLPADSTLAVGWPENPPFPSQYPQNEHFDSPVALSLTITRGFTNYGTIGLYDTSLGSTLNVTTGTLVNAPGGTITSTIGYDTLGKGNTLNAQLDNRGTLTVIGRALTIVGDVTNRGTISLGSQRKSDLFVTNGMLVNAQDGSIICAHWTGARTYNVFLAADVSNQGTITVDRNYLEINLSGDSQGWTYTGNTFVNRGRIQLVDGANCSIAGIASPGDLGSYEGHGLLTIQFSNWNLAADWTVPSQRSVVLAFRDSTVSVPGTLTNPAGNTLFFWDTTFNADVVNRGTLGSGPNGTLNGQLTLPSGSSLEVGFGTLPFLGEPPIVAMALTLTVTQGFTNHGRIELFNVSQGSMLTVTGGPLVNASDGSITSSLGVFSGGSTNSLNAQLDNQGTLNVAGADLTINQQPTGSSFRLANQDQGALDVAAGRALTIGGTALVNRGDIRLHGNGIVDFVVPVVSMDGQGTLQGEPAGTVHVRGSLLGNTQNAASHTPPGTVLLDGKGTAATPQLLEVMQADAGDDPASYTSHPAYGSLVLGTNTYVKLVDQARNSASKGAEAAYADSLTIPAGSTLDLNHLRLYAHQTSSAGNAVNVPSAWHNYANPRDVNADGVVTPLDALILVNAINAHQDIPTLPVTAHSRPLYYDVTDGPEGDGDGHITVLDVLIVVNFLNRHSTGSAEGEAAIPPAVVVPLPGAPALPTGVLPFSAAAEQSLTPTATPTSASSLAGTADLQAADPAQVPAAISASAADSALAEGPFHPASESDLSAIDARLAPLDDILSSLASDVDGAWRD
jgi:hypothetical protein